MTEEGERRPREMQEELEVEKKRKVEELEELAKEMEREYENRVKKALAQFRFSLCERQFLQSSILCRDVHSDQLKQKAHDFDKKFEKKVIFLSPPPSSNSPWILLRFKAGLAAGDAG